MPNHFKTNKCSEDFGYDRIRKILPGHFPSHMPWMGSFPPSQNPSPEPFPEPSEPYLERCVAVRPLRRAPNSLICSGISKAMVCNRRGLNRVAFTKTAGITKATKTTQTATNKGADYWLSGNHGNHGHDTNHKNPLDNRKCGRQVLLGLLGLPRLLGLTFSATRATFFDFSRLSAFSTVVAFHLRNRPVDGRIRGATPCIQRVPQA